MKPLSEEEIAELDARLRNACADHVKYGHPGSAAVVLKYHELAALLATAREAAELREIVDSLVHVAEDTGECPFCSMDEDSPHDHEATCPLLKAMGKPDA